MSKQIEKLEAVADCQKIVLQGLVAKGSGRTGRRVRHADWRGYSGKKIACFLFSLRFSSDGSVLRKDPLPKEVEDSVHLSIGHVIGIFKVLGMQHAPSTLSMYRSASQREVRPSWCKIPVISDGFRGELLALAAGIKPDDLVRFNSAEYQKAANAKK